MDRASESGRAPETKVSDERSVIEIFNRAGVNGLVGFEYYSAQPGEYGRKKVRIEQANPDGQTFRVMDIGAKSMIENNIFTGKLIIGEETRSEDDPVIRLLRHLIIDARPFLDPNLRVEQQGTEEYRTSVSRSGSDMQPRRSEPPENLQQICR
jgi:hypothetical protein